ncbi:leucine--tRNA ligase [Enterobacterales bacterium endosymbiont of Anomoneura mori]|uniref:leucine--tRNA ligase n=1 Tax=Enterobacterales bacterium endosymbiont of Anomoneura mori TaxID=3132096 RepID=UPI00399D4AED
MYKKYLFKNIEKNVQKYWLKKKFFNVNENNKKKKYYVLCMIPYPSGKLHMGHVRNYTIGDVISRFQRMKGKNVMQPMGWDAFGLPAETSAIINNISPSIWTYKNIKNMKKQLQSLGFSYDWDREIITCKPEYYKWEQWFFLKLYEKKLIYKKKTLVNWCEYDKTVLANEQVINNKCWRCDNKIKKKNLSQYFIKITNYAEQLLNDLKHLKYWPKKVKNMQKNWIGKINTIEIIFEIFNNNKKIKILSNSLDNFMNVTYIMISLSNLFSIKESKKNIKIKQFIYKYKNKYNNYNINSKGIFTNLFAIHPITKKKLPIWIVNCNLFYNLYNSNLAIPKNNIFDFKFAKKYNIQIKFKKNILNKLIIKKNIFLDLLKFDKLNNINKNNIISNILINLNIYKKKTFYKLHDWNISRQRYWGAPIPIINNKKNIIILKKQLPIILPENILINNIKNFLKFNFKWFKILYNNKYIKFNIDTFDTFIESSWYYIRYTSPKYNKSIINLKSINYWLPIDQYIGGIEHSVMHLLYFRFFHKLFRDFGLVNTNEPAKKLICQGMVLSEAFYYFNKKNEKIWINKNKINIKYNNNKKNILLTDKEGNKVKYAGMIKMSKSKNNGVDPKIIIKKYGADTVRLFIMFASPIEMELEWKESQLIGIYRFLKRIWKMVIDHIKNKKLKPLKILILNKKQKKIFFFIHKIIYKITYDIEKRQHFNTAISKIMKFVNKLNYFKKNNYINDYIFHEFLLILIRLLNPFVPHICFKLWKLLYEKDDIDFVSWPIFNKFFLIKKKINIIIQINGKFYNNILIKKDLKKENILKKIKKKFFNKKINFKNIYKIIYISNKIFNIILKS